MKIFRVDSFSPDGSTVFSLMADSAFRPDRRPLFIRDGQLICDIRPAIRISRLGKAVSQKFASRYFSEFTLINYTHGHIDNPFDNIADDAIICGSWLPIDTLPATFTLGTNSKTLTIDDINPIPVISGLSENTTLKNGDIIILPPVLFSFTPSIGRSVEVRSDINSDTILKFNIK